MTIDTTDIILFFLIALVFAVPIIKAVIQTRRRRRSHLTGRDWAVRQNAYRVERRLR